MLENLPTFGRHLELTSFPTEVFENHGEKTDFSENSATSSSPVNFTQILQNGAKCATEFGAVQMCAKIL